MRRGSREVPLAALLALHEEMALRALARIILAVGGSGGAPLRLAKLEACYGHAADVPGAARPSADAGCSSRARN